MVWKDYQHPLAVVGASEIDVIISKRRQKWWKIIPKSYFFPHMRAKNSKITLGWTKGGHSGPVGAPPSFKLRVYHSALTMLYDYLWIRQGLRRRRGGMRGPSCRACCVIRYWLRCVRWNCDTAPRLAGSTRWVDAAGEDWPSGGARCRVSRCCLRLPGGRESKPKYPWAVRRRKAATGNVFFLFFSCYVMEGRCFLEATHRAS